MGGEGTDIGIGTCTGTGIGTGGSCSCSIGRYSGSGVRTTQNNKGTEHRTNLAQLRPTMQPSIISAS